MQKVYTMTPDIVHKNISKRLTPKQWVVYYYLMSICNWNGKDRENHYYLYKNKLNIAKASKLLNMSRTTIHNAIKKFINEQRILIEHDDYYLITIPTIFAAIDQKTLSFLLPFQNKLGVDLIRTYAILCRIDQHSELQKTFTKATLISIMGHSITDNSMYYNMELYLGFLNYWGLIDVRYKTLSSSIGKYKEFLLLGVNSISDKNKVIININEPVDEQVVDKIRNEIIREGYWDIE